MKYLHQIMLNPLKYLHKSLFYYCNLGKYAIKYTYRGRNGLPDKIFIFLYSENYFKFTGGFIT